MRAFLVYVRPLVECDSVIWSPSNVHDIAAVLYIEAVQRRFTKRLPGLAKLSYGERLKYLSVPSLGLRRFHIDLLWCYKITFGLVQVDLGESLVFSSYRPTRGHE